MRVGLGERARDSFEPRGQHHRPRDEAARAEYCIRLTAAKDGAAGDRRRERPAQRARLLPAGPARQPGHGERVELVAVLRNEPRLDAIR
jgi:hypothetical protein